MTEKESTRRGFLEIIIGASALATLSAILYPAYKYLVPPPAAEADPSQLKLSFGQSDIAADPKKAKYFKYGRDLGIIFLTDTGELKALSATCTHLSCTVQNLPDQGIIWCACHNGKYSPDGKNISGPPPRPLAPFKVKVVDKDIFVSRETA